MDYRVRDYPRFQRGTVHGQVRLHYASPEDFIDFLNETLIPDLIDSGKYGIANDFMEAIFWIRDGMGIYQSARESIHIEKSKPKRKQSKKQKILEEMTQKKWKQYSKGSGKKNYFQIKAWVSKTAAYKKRVKKL
jgi:hypothetical protein